MSDHFSMRFTVGILLTVGTSFLGPRVVAQPFNISFPQPTLDRWMYSHNSDPAGNVAAPIFATFGDDSGVDTRLGQFLVGFDTFNVVATNRGPSNYLIRRVRVT